MRRVLSESSDGSVNDEEEVVRRRRGHESPEVRKFNEDSVSENSDDEQIVALNDDEEPFLEPGAVCKEHGLKLHSWDKTTKKILCTQCI